MAKFESILKKIFYISLGIFPLAIGCILGTVVLINALTTPDSGGTNIYSHGPLLNLPFCILVSVALVGLLVLVYVKYSQPIKEFLEKNQKWMPLIILVSALAARLVLFFIFRWILVPFSDSANVWSVAVGERDNKIFRRKLRQNGWNNFSAWAYLCVQFLNFKYSDFVALQMVVDAFIAVLAYLILYKAIKKADVALLAGMTYALAPTVILRDLFFSPDVYSLFGVMVGIYLLAFVFRKEKFGVAEYGFALAAGLFIGLGNSVKSSAVIMAVAIIIVMVMKAMRTPEFKNKRMSYVMVALLVIVPAFGVNKVALWGRSIVMNYPVQDLNTWHFINVGLNPYGEGTLGAPHASNYQGWIESGQYTPEEARDMTIEFLKTAWKETERPVLPWLWRKTKMAWRDDFHTYSKIGLNSINYRNTETDLQKNIITFWGRYENSIQQCMYVVTMAFASLGALTVMKKHSDSDELFIISLFAFGFSLLLLISECQARYKTNIMPMLYILSAVGFVQFCEFCRKAIRK